MEIDFNRELKDECSVHTARMYMVETTRSAEIEMIESHAPNAARDLATINPDLLVFGCTSAGSLFGADYDLRICKQLGDIANATALGVMSAVTKELELAGGRHLAVLTPYVEELTVSVANAAASESRHISVAVGMGISDNVTLSDPSPQDILQFARESLAGHEFDSLLVSCTNFRALEAVPLLEDVFGVPVVTSNGAIIAAIRNQIGFLKEASVN
ncbi:maleate cis-trans isomerase family protein [Brucella pseudogrignonensis]|uniref:maleate cis-trans isomerase family protein n=1 Tax=Brucella pseudogrignonensis TaxID=419475 RepID=UPI003D995B64